jgi:ribosomal protein RSM22 (predicted rRNA methylase)
MRASTIRGLTRNLPARLHAIAENKLQHYSDKEFRQEAKYHLRIMQNVKLPDDEATLEIKKAEIKTELEIRGKLGLLESDDSDLAEESLIKKGRLSQIIQGMLDERRRDWHYYEYDERAALMYMATRLAPNYASIKSVMNEIKVLDPKFKPRSVLDFGSGMGTTIWAVNETWPKEVSEFMNIDLSKEQQNLCEYLLRDGKDFGQPLETVFHRQYLPSSNRVRYDMVVVAFTLLELPNRELRAQTIENLWHKTNDLLVIVERGNKGGFSTVNEARNFVLDLSGYDVTKRVNLTSQTRPITKLKPIETHILAPCPHEFICPRSLMPSKRRLDICRFSVPYEPLGFGERKMPMMREEYSYVVLRKRPHPNCVNENYEFRWPRIVECPQRRGKHVNHKLCCPDGTLVNCTISKKKYDKESYEAAKDGRWGETLKVKLRENNRADEPKLLKGCES